ncbi:hypothetical protein CBR_g32014 [Chara braunii]|uniref:Sec-independent protein translocase protein TatB n=1 Tax=Chara braunii TaxID=69332 RepID=A0A388LGC5_CHABU|nr:hypothetical protein CBR_g32014 [Chara braunii]|eukprot:GBG81341.1 hypothetical protein CBR_g32014 [Chara braunii]
MLFGISIEQWAAIILVGATVFGPKDIPVIGRAAGRMAGKAVGFLTSARHRMELFAERTQVNELHRELRETLAQVEAIRHEVQSGVSLMNPGPLTRRVLKHASPDSAVNGQNLASSMSEMSNDARAGDQPSTDVKTVPQNKPNDLLSTERRESSFPRHWEKRSQLTGFAAASQWGPGDAVMASNLESTTAIPQSSKTSETVKTQKTSSDTGYPIPLPISAVDAGLLPSRSDSACTGADIVADSIVEREVALQALRFFHQAGIPVGNGHQHPRKSNP